MTKLLKQPWWDDEEIEATRKRLNMSEPPESLDDVDFAAQRQEQDKYRAWMLSIIESDPYAFRKALGLIKDDAGYFHA